MENQEQTQNNEGTERKTQESDKTANASEKKQNKKKKKSSQKGIKNPKKANATSFQTANQLWKLANVGRKKLFETPEELLEAANEYFAWIDDNPLYKVETASSFGVITQEPIAVMRPYTITGLCIYLGCDTQYLDGIKDAAFSVVVKHIKNTIYTQKFEGASANLLNANIIARDLGLRDSTDVTSANKPIIPEEIDLTKFNDEQLASYIALQEIGKRTEQHNEGESAKV